MEFIFVRNVIFISDYERDISIPNDNVVMCSVGVDEEFNKKCLLKNYYSYILYAKFK